MIQIVWDEDQDGDGLTNVEQADVYGTDPLSPDTDGDGVCDLTEVEGLVRRFVADHGEKGYKFYTSWEEITEDHGPPDKSFNYATNPLNPDTDFDGLNDSVDPIPKDYDMNGNNRINHPDLVDPDSDYYVERIARAVRHDEHLERQHGELIPSIDMSGDDVPNDEAEDMTRDGMLTEYEEEVGVADGGWQHPYLHNERYAMLVASGDEDEDRNYPGFWNDIHHLYDVLVDDYNYIEDNVYLLYSEWNGVDHSDGCEDIDDEASWDGVERTLENISKRITTNDFLTIAMSGHGSDDGHFHFADEDSVVSDHKKYEEFSPYLDDMSYNRMAIMISSCYSGTAIEPLSGINRIIMTSSDEDELSFMTLGTSDSGAFFYEGRRYRMLGLIEDVYEGMFRNLGSQEAPRDLSYAFLKGRWAAENNKSLASDGTSNPQITNSGIADWTYL